MSNIWYPYRPNGWRFHVASLVLACLIQETAASIASVFHIGGAGLWAVRLLAGIAFTTAVMMLVLSAFDRIDEDDE